MIQLSVIGNKGKNNAETYKEYHMTTREHLTVRSLLFHTTLDEKTMATCIIFCNYNASGEHKRTPDKNPAQCVFFSLFIYYFDILLHSSKMCDWKINNTQVFN